MKQSSFSPQNTTARSHPSLRWPLVATLILAVIESAQAHPGHSLGEYGVGHVASSPYHVSILAGTGLLLWLGARFIHRPFARRALQTTGILALVLAAAWWGVRV
jgi:hypothetical protein